MCVLAYCRDSCGSAPIIIKMALLEWIKIKLKQNFSMKILLTHLVCQNLHLVWRQLKRIVNDIV